MPFQFEKFLTEATGRAPAQRAVFDPPRLTPLRKPVAESTIGLYVSCGAQAPEDPPQLHAKAGSRPDSQLAHFRAAPCIE